MNKMPGSIEEMRSSNSACSVSAHRGGTQAGRNEEQGILVNHVLFVFNMRQENRNLGQAEIILLEMRMRPEVSGCQAMKNRPDLLQNLISVLLALRSLQAGDKHKAEA